MRISTRHGITNQDEKATAGPLLYGSTEVIPAEDLKSSEQTTDKIESEEFDPYAITDPNFKRAGIAGEFNPE